MKWVALLIFSVQCQAAEFGWLEAIAAGKDQKAAQMLEEFYAQGWPPQADSKFQKLIAETAEFLRNGFDCKEKDKITLYRRMTPGRTDADLPDGNKNIVFPARAFMTKRREFKSSGLTKALSLRVFDSVKQVHSHPLFNSVSYNKSYLISTSTGDEINFNGIPTNAPVSAVLRVCRSRIIPGRTSENEILLPFFIHPNEVVAVAELNQGDFKILYSWIEKSEMEIKRLIWKLAGSKPKSPNKCARYLKRKTAINEYDELDPENSNAFYKY